MLLTLSVSHALAQSTLLARYETLTHATLSSNATKSIPIRLASTGSLRLSRTDALKLTGKLFKLRRDVNLVSNVLDIPDLFWEEGQASLRALYDAVRVYMEIGASMCPPFCCFLTCVSGVRVGVLNEKIAVAEDLVRCFVAVSYCAANSCTSLMPSMTILTTMRCTELPGLLSGRPRKLALALTPTYVIGTQAHRSCMFS